MACRCPGRRAPATPLRSRRAHGKTLRSSSLLLCFWPRDQLLGPTEENEKLNLTGRPDAVRAHTVAESSEIQLRPGGPPVVGARDDRQRLLDLDALLSAKL